MPKFADHNLVFNPAFPLPICLGNNAEIIYLKFSNTNLSYSNLKGASLEGADLINAKITNNQLAEAKSLKGATNNTRVAILAEMALMP